MEVLAPAVQDGSDADVGAEVLGVGRDGGERLGRGRKQQSIDLGLVLVGDRADCGWQREHHVEVRHRQQFGFARRKPRLGGRPLALGAVPVAARVIGDACVWAQFSQRSTWPPSAAVRQTSIAVITRRWLRLRRALLAARQAAPWRWKTSATSSFGWDTAGAMFRNSSGL